MTIAADKFGRLTALKPARNFPQKPAGLRAPDETDELSQLLGAGIARNHYGEHLAVRNWFATPEFAEPSAAALDLLTKPSTTKSARQRAGAVSDAISRATRMTLEDPHKWLFLDTETTGLAGGTGTYAFLVGLAWWDGGGLQIEQLFMRDYAQEHSLLQELAERLAERPVLVTFNGKSFDWPLLESRFTMTRAIRVPRLAAHLDLLHPARAIWKLRLGSVRLVELERHVLDASRLGWHREDDIASSLIPQYFFDYLRGGSARPLAGVVKHNQMDLRGLAALYTKINSLLDGRDSFEDTGSLDLFGISRFLHRRGENVRAQSACSKALSAGLPPEYRPQATRELALHAKKRGDRELAAALWLELASDSVDGIAACEQLAIHHERHTRDFAQAVQYAKLALAKVRRQIAHSPARYATARVIRLEQKLVCRLERLLHRISRAESAHPAPLLTHSAAAGSGPRPRSR
jgi:uncharacterized protein YprB with RNaseH-like and TPR domain